MKKIAFCYDFDGTLSSGNMQEQDLLPDCNITSEKFWGEVIETSKNIKADPELTEKQKIGMLRTLIDKLTQWTEIELSDDVLLWRKHI